MLSKKSVNNIMEVILTFQFIISLRPSEDQILEKHMQFFYLFSFFKPKVKIQK